MAEPSSADTPKRPFRIGEALRLVRAAVAGHARAALFELRDEGHTSVFEILVACIISIRTRDEATLPIARRLFAHARTPAAVAAMTTEQLERLIAGCSFVENKAPQIHEIARIALARHGGELPADRDVLLGLRGVGPKCANLTLGIASGEPSIGVDVHVHRITNRWGYVRTKNPEDTLLALEQKLPRRHWVEINELLVPFGKHICLGQAPRCPTCPLLTMCQQVGVTKVRGGEAR